MAGTRTCVAAWFNGVKFHMPFKQTLCRTSVVGNVVGIAGSTAAKVMLGIRVHKTKQVCRMSLPCLHVVRFMVIFPFTIRSCYKWDTGIILGVRDRQGFLLKPISSFLNSHYLKTTLLFVNCKPRYTCAIYNPRAHSLGRNAAAGPSRSDCTVCTILPRMSNIRIVKHGSA